MILPQRLEVDGNRLAEERLGLGVFLLRIQVGRDGAVAGAGLGVLLSQLRTDRSSFSL
jgi:hypothetical protein